MRFLIKIFLYETKNIIKPFIDKSRIKSEEAKRLFNIAFQDVEESESGKKYKEFEIPKEAFLKLFKPPSS